MIFNIIVILFSIFNVILASSNAPSWRNSHRIRNISFKFVIFKEKKMPKLLGYINNKYQTIYEKTLVMVAEGVAEYENLSYEDKELIDFIFSTLIG